MLLDLSSMLACGARSGSPSRDARPQALLSAACLAFHIPSVLRDCRPIINLRLSCGKHGIKL